MRVRTSLSALLPTDWPVVVPTPNVAPETWRVAFAIVTVVLVAVSPVAATTAVASTEDGVSAATDKTGTQAREDIESAASASATSPTLAGGRPGETGRLAALSHQHDALASTSSPWQHLIEQTPTRPEAGQRIEFEANETAAAEIATWNVTRYEWRFGNGTVVTGPSATHTYETSGFYVVNLTVYTEGESGSGVFSKEQFVRARVASELPDGVVERRLSNGTVYQRSHVVSMTGTFEPGTAVGVTGRINVTRPQASNNVVYGVLGSANGTTVDVKRMDGVGNGTVTTAALLPDSANGTRLVWSFYATTSASTARSQFEHDANDSSFPNGTDAVAITTVGEPLQEGAPPDARFTARPSGPLSITFDASGSSDDGSVDAYEWHFGDGTSATGRTVTHTYETIGEHPVTLTVTDEQGATDTKRKTVSVDGPWKKDERDPAEFTVVNRTSVTLSAGDCGVLSAWRVDDSQGDAIDISFDYEYHVETDDQRPRITVFDSQRSQTFDIGSSNDASGHFERTVPAEDRTTINFVLSEGCHDGGSDIALYVRNFEATRNSETSSPPAAAISLRDPDPHADEPITFDAGRSFDDGTITDYRWSFGDGTTATGRRVDHVFPTAGTYTVRLTVTDDQHTTDSVDRTVEVDPSLRSPDDGGGETTRKPDLRSIAYGQTKSGYVDAADPKNESFLAGLRYEPVSFSGSAGDVVSIGVDSTTAANVSAVRLWGPSGHLLATGETTQYELPADGSYVIQVGYAWGTRGGYEVSLTRENDAIPRVSISQGPGDAVVGTPESFEATVSSDDPIESYEWRFGDGTTASGSTVAHTFAKSGNDTVAVTVTDTEGLTDTATLEVVVESVIEHRYDADDDGLELPEINAALEDLTGSDDDGNLSVHEVRKLIDDYAQARRTNRTDTDGDGLPDVLEKKGIPVVRTFEFSDVGEGANVTDPLPGDPVGIERIKTDPYDADTDGDGVPDGQEVGARKTTSPPRSHVYYRLRSDPTDPNTDDTGMRDGAEYKKGSNPRDPEHFSVNLVMPVIAEDVCNPGTLRDPHNCAKEVYDQGQPNPAYGIKAVEQFNYNSGALDRGDVPTWMDDVYDSPKVQPKYSYYLVRAHLNTTTSGDYPSKLPRHLYVSGFKGGGTLVGVGHNRSLLGETWRFDLFEDGHGVSDTVYLVVRSNFRVTQPGDARYKRFGRLQLRMTVPKGPYTRGTVSGSLEEQTITSRHGFGVRDVLPQTSKDEAKDMLEEATRKFGTYAAAAALPVTGGALGAPNAVVLSGGTQGTLVFAEGWAMFTGINGRLDIGPDDVFGKIVVGEGSIPAFVTSGSDSPPTTNIVIGTYRAN